MGALQVPFGELTGSQYIPVRLTNPLKNTMDIQHVSLTSPTTASFLYFASQKHDGEDGYVRFNQHGYNVFTHEQAPDKVSDLFNITQFVVRAESLTTQAKTPASSTGRSQQMSQ
jgi:hypothetical protein